MTGTVTTVPGCKCNATLSMLKMTNLTSTTIGAAKLATIEGVPTLFMKNLGSDQRLKIHFTS